MKYLTTPLLLLVIISCKKTEIEQLSEFPSALYLNRISIKSKTRLYSDKKEITDQLVIDRFLKSNGGFKLRDSSFVSDEHIKFFSPDSAEIPDLFNSLLITKMTSKPAGHSARAAVPFPPTSKHVQSSAAQHIWHAGSVRFYQIYYSPTY